MIYPALVFGSILTVAVVTIFASHYLPAIDTGFLFANDFAVFWSASHLALNGHAADAYQIEKLFDALQLVYPALSEPKPWLHWFYPPTFLLAVLPLAAFPFLLSYALFVSTTLAAYAAMLRRIAHGRNIWLLVLGFPPTIITALNGQNAFLTATLAGTSLLLLERRPVLAGVCIGLLAIKPHLAILFPLALLCARAWTAIAAAAVTAAGMACLSVFVLGVDTVPAFLHSLDEARQLATSGDLPLAKMPTMFGAARLLDASPMLANSLHGALALFGACAVVLVWRRPAPLYLRASVLITSSLLVSPHLFDYDLAWLALPIAWLGMHGLQHGWLRGERELLVATWISPLVSECLAQLVSIQLEPLVLALLIVHLLHRARLGQAPHASAAWVLDA